MDGIHEFRHAQGRMDTEENMIFDNQIIVAILGIVGGIILGIPSMLAVMVSLNKMNSEKVKNLAESAEAVANACNKLRNDMERQVATLEKQIASDREYNLSLEKRVTQQEEEIVHLRRDNDHLKDGMVRFRVWAERLVKQVEELGGKPTTLEEIEEVMSHRRIADENLGK
jgi:septal ring factor EnvC (AmiA/AmiB activator)